MAIDTAKRFGYGWNKYREMFPYYEEQFLGWISPLSPDFIKGKKVLDAGCGMGRNSFWCLRYGADEIVAIDNDARTIQAAHKTLGAFGNARVEKKDIYRLDYRDYFDFVFSIGVIHHLEFPKEALEKLAASLKKGGTLLVWLYGYEGNAPVVKTVKLLRSLLSKLPEPALHYLALVFSVPLFVYLRLFKPANPYLRRVAKYNFRHIHYIVYDQLVAPIARYYRREEVEKLFEGFKDVSIVNKERYSWTVICRKG